VVETASKDEAQDFFEKGTRAHQAGLLEEARAHYERAVALKPDYLLAHFNLGVVRQSLGDSDGAAACFERVLQLNPGVAEAHNGLGLAFRKLEKLDRAKAHYRKALELKPDYADAYSNLGVLLRQMGDLEASAGSLAKALSLKPNSAGVLDNLGNTLRDQGHLVESEKCHRRAIELQPNSANAHSNLGYTLRKQGRLREARESMNQARALAPGEVEIRWNLSLLDLLEGKFAEGWKGYEIRHERRENRPRSFAKPMWRGQALSGARILLHSEQGLGDSIQFLRYVPLVEAAGGKVILNVPSTLRRLAGGVAGVERVTVEGATLPEFDWHCPLMSLPLAFGTRLESIPSDVPYLKVPEEAKKAADELPQPDGRVSVGLVWSGNPKSTEDRMRSMALSTFEALLALERVRFFSLQLGAAAGQMAAFGGKITDLRPRIKDFADTAAWIDRLDLIVTVDTSVAHLAGALGKSTWVLLPSAPDWRWLLDRDDSPWYPTMRLFRQTRFGDWAEVVERVRRELAALR
jgi:tetratricopeptide (TPR) repeat protein